MTASKNVVIVENDSCDELETPQAIYEEKTTDLKETEKKLKTEGKDPLHFFQWVTDEVLSSLNEYGILKFFNTTFLLNTANAVWTFEMPISIEFPTLGEADPLHFFHWAYEKMYSSLNEYAIIPFFNTTSNLLKASQSLWTMEIPMSISYFSLESIDPFRFFHWINEEVQRGLNEYGILSFFNTTSFLNTSCALWTFDMPISFPSFTATGNLVNDERSIILFLKEVPIKKPELKPTEVKKEVPLKKPEPKPAEVKKEVPLKKPEPKPAEVKKEVPLKKSEPKPAEVKKDELKTPKAIYEEKTTDKKEDEKHKKEKKADLKETEKKLKTEGKVSVPRSFTQANTVSVSGTT
eukprot:XP_017949481.1 PREDICTED: uncharacterized protein LOC101735278 [Xenopus tropicalis]